MEDTLIRQTAVHYAVETHPLRFNVDQKPTVEDILERAKKYYDFMKSDSF